jgi:hypothetical protein
MKNTLRTYINKKKKKKEEAEEQEIQETEESQDVAMLQMLEQIAADESKMFRTSIRTVGFKGN